MADPALFKFNHKEVVEALIKQQGLHEGIWQLYIEFNLTAANINVPTDEKTLTPAAILMVKAVGITKVEKENNLTMDAAKVNPMKTE